MEVAYNVEVIFNSVDAIRQAFFVSDYSCHVRKKPLTIFGA
jgi:hypothetical protein